LFGLTNNYSYNHAPFDASFISRSHGKKTNNEGQGESRDPLWFIVVDAPIISKHILKCQEILGKI
jgi:hypothetical protein